ncbi:MAG: putative DNA-binding domain-containing protein [Gloeobacteraceae cyanobacterium ES-bin-144]|nr:putative DNA-binding domain-containing protein [Verrucomicrobiales bacterium]
MKPLEQLQREFFAALQMPLRGRSRASTELAESTDGHSPVFLAKAEELMKASANLSSAERLELYHRQYWFRLMDSVAEDFPELQKLAGEELFWKIIEAYLLEYPSSSFTLRHLGSRMADFIASWSELDAAQRIGFSALARLEYAYMQIYEAAEWDVILPENILECELTLQPHVVLLALPVAADLFVKEEEFPLTIESPIWLAVWRGENGSPTQCRLDEVEYTLLQRLRLGGSLASLFTEPTSRQPTPEEVAAWFENWQRRRWIVQKPAAGQEAHIRRREQTTDWSGVDKMGSQARAMED